MIRKPLQSAERVSAHDPSDNYVYQRSLLAYHYAAERVSGDVLEIGTGSGYGVRIIAPKVRSYITIDKYDCNLDLAQCPNVEFRRMKVPPLGTIASASVDFVVTFQVIEHIADDRALVAEIARVLRPGGQLVVSTPNKAMSLTRNPWHVREYTPAELANLLGREFYQIEELGVLGNDRVMEYYERNRRSVERYAAFDPLRLRERLPRWMLRAPYDVLNRVNRRRLLASSPGGADSPGDPTGAGGIAMDDYRVAPVEQESSAGSAGEGCFDLLYIATKDYTPV